MAHIIGKKEDGPRGDDELPISQRDEYDNLILLCPNCHTTVDKNPHLYPKETIEKWKKEHEESIRYLFVAPKFETREEARKYLFPFFVENKAIFDRYGPYSENAANKQMETEREWERLCLQKLLPNNRKIEAVVAQNINLLTEDELKLFTQFKIHREGFEYNKLSGDVNATVPTFPEGFEKILI